MKLILILTTLLAVLSWAFFAYIVFFIPPKISGHLAVSNLVYFFISGFFAFSFTASLVFYYVISFFRPKTRSLDTPNQTTKIYIKSARRGFLLAFLVLGLSILKVSDLLNLLNGALLIGTITLIEVYFVR